MPAQSQRVDEFVWSKSSPERQQLSSVVDTLFHDLATLQTMLHTFEAASALSVDEMRGWTEKLKSSKDAIQLDTNQLLMNERMYLDQRRQLAKSEIELQSAEGVLGTTVDASRFKSRLHDFVENYDNDLQHSNQVALPDLHRDLQEMARLKAQDRLTLAGAARSKVGK